MKIRLLLTASVLSVLVPASWSTGQPAATAAAVGHATHATHGAARPKLGAVSVSRTRLPGGGGTLTISARVTRAVRCRLTAKPSITTLPRSTDCRTGRATWHVRVPASQAAASTTYHFTVTVTAASHRVASKRRTVVLAATTRSPRLSTVAASSRKLASNGGSVTVTASALRAKRCTLTVVPAILGLPRTASCAKGTSRWTATLPPNDLDSSTTYTFEVTALGSHHQQAKRATSVTVAAQHPTCPGQTSVARPQTTAVFNDPSTGDPVHQDAIVNNMINLICDVSPPANGTPSEIDLAMFLYQLPAVSDALLWAHQYRGAVVHVVLDGGNAYIANSNGTNSANPAYTALIQGSDGMAKLPSGSVVLCGADADQQPPPPDDGEESTFTPDQTACAGENIMHTKLLLVSSIDTAGDPAVLASSQNLATNAEVAAFNDGMQIIGNRSIYATNHTYVEQLQAHQKQTDPDLGDQLGDTTASLAGAAVTSMFFPRNDPSTAFPANDSYDEADDAVTDPVPKLLDRVRCTTDPGAFSGDHSGTTARTVVDLAMYSYGERDSITQALANLGTQGCEVNVLYDSIDSAAKSTLSSTPNVRLMQLNDKSFPFTNGSGNKGHVFVHDKFLLISGAVADSDGTTLPNQDIVQAGSQNYTEPALHFNDDEDLRVEQTATSATGSVLLFSGYQQDFAHLWQVAASVTAG